MPIQIKAIYLVIFTILLLCACKANHSKFNFKKPIRNIQLSEMEWMLGSWFMISGDNSLTQEIWTKKNDQQFSGFSFTTTKGDTVFSETMVLEIQNNNMFYSVLVNDHNNNKYIDFKLMNKTLDEYHFENKYHDFPKKIIYKKSNGDSLYARIEGKLKGKLLKEEFFYLKMRNP
jgi:hypothetical protein